MSTAAATLATDDGELNKRFDRLLRHYDAEAMRYKRRLLTLWGVSMGFTWVPLMLAIAGLAGWFSTWFVDALRVVILPAAGFGNALVTVAQVIFMFRGRWLKYRAATERLRENCMRFRARLRPFNHEDSEKHFQIALDELEMELGERKPFRWRELLLRYVIGLRHLPAQLRDARRTPRIKDFTHGVVTTSTLPRHLSFFSGYGTSSAGTSSRPASTRGATLRCKLAWCYWGWPAPYITDWGDMNWERWRFSLRQPCS